MDYTCSGIFHSVIIDLAVNDFQHFLNRLNFEHFINPVVIDLAVISL